MSTDAPPHDAAVSRLRAAGLRVTLPRVGVLLALEEHPHADADTVARHVRASSGAVSTQAVYDILHALTRAGIIRCIEPAGSPARYETRVGDNHHHLVCRGCGVVVDVDCHGDAVPCLVPEPGHGFDVDEAEVTFWGLCPRCRASAEQPGSNASDRTSQENA